MKGKEASGPPASTLPATSAMVLAYHNGLITIQRMFETLEKPKGGSTSNADLRIRGHSSKIMKWSAESSFKKTLESGTILSPDDRFKNWIRNPGKNCPGDHLRPELGALGDST